ncbi:hypothetical protein JQX13_28975 [Archangium violaceum]|uniref:hypothetical protein n=1 Tax=Archangium violaceum TaxID=83451 RepID=UPI00193C6D83|nr:hypothetical protein [Archangium violaceum]QRK04297.1 hypothetical protein JQX13_28975 [Archangium violaceum]
MSTPSVPLSIEARQAEFEHWIHQQIVSASRWGFGWIFTGMAFILVGGQSFLKQIDMGERLEAMAFPGHLPLWGLMAIVFGVLQLIRAPRYYRRLRRIVAARRPVTMYMTIRIEKSSDSTHEYADLRLERNRTAPTPDIVVSLATPPWPGGSARIKETPRDQRVQVHGAQARGPVVIETEWGFFWPSSDFSTKYP